MVIVKSYRKINKTLFITLWFKCVIIMDWGEFFYDDLSKKEGDNRFGLSPRIRYANGICYSPLSPNKAFFSSSSEG